MSFGLIVLNDRLEDDKTKYCGGDDPIFPHYSAYVLDDINSDNTDDVPYYKYFQCMTQELYSSITEVLPEELVQILQKYPWTLVEFGFEAQDWPILTIPYSFALGIILSRK